MTTTEQAQRAADALIEDAKHQGKNLLGLRRFLVASATRDASLAEARELIAAIPFSNHKLAAAALEGFVREKMTAGMGFRDATYSAQHEHKQLTDFVYPPLRR